MLCASLALQGLEGGRAESAWALGLGTLVVLVPEALKKVHFGPILGRLCLNSMSLQPCNPPQLVIWSDLCQ